MTSLFHALCDANHLCELKALIDIEKQELTFHFFISEPTNRKRTRRPPVQHILGEAIRFKRRTAKSKLSR